MGAFKHALSWLQGIVFVVDRERHGGGSSRNAWFPFEPFAVEALPVAPHIWCGFPVWCLHEPKTTLPPPRRQRRSVAAADPIALWFVFASMALVLVDPQLATGSRLRAEDEAAEERLRAGALVQLELSDLHRRFLALVVAELAQLADEPA